MVANMHDNLMITVDGVVFQTQIHGGISRLYNEILPRMCDLDHTLQITLYTDGRIAQAPPKHPGITHRSIFTIQSYLRPSRVWKPIIPTIRRLVRELHIGHGENQIWHSTYYTMPEHWIGKQVVTVVDMIHERFADLFSGPGNDAFKEQKKQCVLRSNAVICISETTRQDVQDFYNLDSDSLYVVPLACSDSFKTLERSKIKLILPNREPFILYIGNRSHYKNFERLLQAYSVWRYRNEISLVIVGQSWSTEEKQRLMELKVQNRVHLLTNTNDEDLCQLYNQAAMFVYPSLYEGFGIPLLEAMACGCPVVASRIPSTVEVVGECPIYFEPTEIDDLCTAFEIALSQGRNSERVRTSFERVRDYSWDKTARQTLEVYRALSNPD